MRSARGSVFKLGLEVGAVIDIVAEDKRRRGAANEIPADEESLGQPAGRRLDRVVQVQAPLAAVTQQLMETPGLWLVEHLAKPGKPAGYDRRRDFALTLLLLLSPIAFFLGTNMPVLEHSAITSLFAFCAVYLRLFRLADAGMLTGPALTIALVLPAIPASSAQGLALTNTRHTYRQASALARQDTR